MNSKETLDTSFTELPLDEQLRTLAGDNDLKSRVSMEGVQYTAESVIDKNTFYRKITMGMLYLMFTLIAAITIAILVIGYVSVRPPITLTYSIDNDGNIVELAPIDVAGMTDADLLDWATKRAMNIHELSFHDWEDHVQSMSSYFTEEGHVNYQWALKKSDLFRRITENNQVSWAEPASAPRIRKAEVINGVFTWVVDMEFYVYIGGGNKSTIPVLASAVMVVQRTDKAVNNYGVLINQYLADVKE